MPLYDYICVSCGRTEERNVNISERDEQHCECGGSLAREISFKGSVWAPSAGGMK